MRTCLRKIGILAAAILFAASVSLALLFTACPNNAGGNTGGGTPASVSYRITFRVDGGHGTLKATAEGVAETDKSPISVEKDKTVTFTAKPEAGYKVDKWAITGGTFEAGAGTNGSLTAKVKITANTEVKVSFEELPPGSYTVKHYQEKTEGGYPAEPTENEILSGTPETNAQYTPKTYTGFTYKPALTKVNGIVQENGTIAADNSTVVELYYERNTVNVTFKLAGGNIGGNTSDVLKSGKYGTALTLPADPEKTGFVFKGWNPEPPTPFLYPAANAEYTAQWAPLYAITFGVDGGHGTLKATVDGNEIHTGGMVEQGKTVTFTAEPDAGYKVNKWTITGGTFEAGTGTPGSPTAKVKITAATTVNVSFTKNGYTVTFDAKGGTPVPAAQTVKYKEKASVPSPEPTKEGHTFDGWYNKAGDSPWNFAVNEVTQNTELYAKWRINTYPVTFGTSANGTFKAELAGTVITSGDTVEYGKTVTFTAVPATGYKVNKWTITGGTVEAGTGTPGSTTAKVKITAATTVNVSFTLNTYTVTFGTPANGTLKAEIAGTVITSRDTVEYGKTVTFTASPAAEYKVDKWTVTPASALQEGGTPGSTTAKVKITADINVNVTFTSLYEPVAFGTYGKGLGTYLVNTAPHTDGIYYIKVTGLKKEDLKGSYGSALGRILENHSSRLVALKLEEIPGLDNMNGCFAGCENLIRAPEIQNGVTNMESCFYGCKRLTQAPEIPSSVTEMRYCFYCCRSLTQAQVISNGVTDMSFCFYGCANLTQAPVIPSGVTNMESCFYCCRDLTQAPAIPNGVTNMESCFSWCTNITAVTLKCNYTAGRFNRAFNYCEKLTAGSIKVPAAQLQTYRDNAAKMLAQANWFIADE